MRLWPELRQGPGWRSSQRSPGVDPLAGLGGGEGKGGEGKEGRGRRGRKGMEGKEEPLQTKSLATALPRISFLSYCLQE